MNKFKIWLSKNDFKIFIIILCIVMGYLMIKGLNNYYKEIRDERNKELLNKESKIQYILPNNEESNSVEGKEEFIEDDEYSEYRTINLPQETKNSESYKATVQVVNKIINTLYKANNNTDNTALKREIYNMFSDELIRYFTTGEKEVKESNILDYIFEVKNTSDYAIGNIFKYSEYNNVVRYAVLMRYKVENQEPIYGLLIVNMDFNNETFSYDGTWTDVKYIDNKKIDFIKNKGSNKF